MFRASDVVSFGAYRDEIGSRLAYVRFGRLWMELRFFRGVHRDHFLDRVASCFGDLSFPIEERGAMGFRFFDADDGDALGSWEGRNVHEEWVSAGAGGDSLIAFVWYLSRSYFLFRGATWRNDSDYVERIWLTDLPEGWVLL
jgi:hypothetical protein